MAAFLFVFSPSLLYSFEGPLSVRNHYPIFLHTDQPLLEKAIMENAFSMRLSHSSTYTVQSSKEWEINLDMEITEINLGYRRIVKGLFEIGLEIPVIAFNSGFMDGFLSDYHDTFGLPDYGRSRRPQNEFLYEVRRDGETVIKGRSGIGLGDLRISLKRHVHLSNDFTLSIKGDVELPTGNADKGYGNGSLDAGISLLLDKGISDVFITYWNIGAVFPGDVKGHRVIDLKNFFYGGAVLEAVIGKKFSMVAQLQGQSSIYPETGISAVDRPAYLITIGGRYITERTGLELSLTEDINTSGAPDFIVNLAYNVNL
jgi:hypothetical protein